MIFEPYSYVETGCAAHLFGCGGLAWGLFPLFFAAARMDLGQIGALLAGVTADALGLPAAMWLVAANTYARWRATPLGQITERVETKVVFDLAGELRGKRVLDVGTGDGTYAIEAAERGAVVTALDQEQEMLDATSARAASRGVAVTLRQGRAEHLPFDDASFDAVTAVTVLGFVPDAQRAVREMARVLVPGGRLVLGELGRFSVWAAERRVRGWLGASTWRRARFWSRGDLGSLARDAGLHVLDVRGSVFFPPSGLAARLVAPVEPLLTRLHAPGAAFLALAAEKPELRS